MANISARFILCLMLITFAAVPSLATDYTVGDSSGWALGVDYTTWTSGKTFNPGDNLVFKYTGSHSVDEVSPTDYNACSSANAISSDSAGSTTIPLKTAGTRYFICGSMGHCASGMKLAVTVASGSEGAGGSPASPSTGNGGSTTSPSTPTTTDSPATPTTDSPATPTETPATPRTRSTEPSSAGSLSPIIALFFTFATVMTKLVFS